MANAQSSIENTQTENFVDWEALADLSENNMKKYISGITGHFNSAGGAVRQATSRLSKDVNKIASQFRSRASTAAMALAASLALYACTMPIGFEFGQTAIVAASATNFYNEVVQGMLFTTLATAAAFAKQTLLSGWQVANKMLTTILQKIEPYFSPVMRNIKNIGQAVGKNVGPFVTTARSPIPARI